MQHETILDELLDKYNNQRRLIARKEPAAAFRDEIGVREGGSGNHKRFLGK
jgi:hypothetical protein